MVQFGFIGDQLERFWWFIDSKSIKNGIHNTKITVVTTRNIGEINDSQTVQVNCTKRLIRCNCYFKKGFDFSADNKINWKTVFSHARGGRGHKIQVTYLMTWKTCVDCRPSMLMHCLTTMQFCFHHRRFSRVNWLIDWLIDWLMDWLIDCLFIQHKFVENINHY